jgi:hypothetical protein
MLNEGFFMQSVFSQSARVNFSDWADWLSSIAQHPHHHKNLVEVESQVHYLSFAEIKKMQQAGFSVQVLSIKKVIEITQQIWGEAKVSHKRQILQGLQYIHEQRQTKYDKLFWLVKWFAKLRGIGSQLAVEKEAIEQAKIELVGVQEASQEASIDEKKTIKEKEKPEHQLNSIRIHFQELFESKKDLLKSKEKIDWYTDFFNHEKKLYNLKEIFPDDQWEKVKPEIRELEKQLEECNREMPRFKELIKAFGYQIVKSNLQETLTSLCVDEGMTPEENKRDQVLFQCSQIEIYARYTRRLIKAKRSQLSLSLVTAIEKTWQEIMDKGCKDATTKLLEGHRVIFDPMGGEAYIKESYIEKGTYKAAFVITPFFSLRKEKDRGKFVILQPISAVEEEIEEALLAKGSIQDNVDNPEVGSESETEKSSVIECSRTEEENKNYKIEAANCLKYGKLPGIWPTYKVITLDGQVAIIQLTAGYFLQTVSGQKKIAPTLADMGIFFKDQELLVKDQSAYIKMAGDFLIGVENLHKLGIIHRDLKPSNVLCSEEGSAAVSDLGTICENDIPSEASEKDHPLEAIDKPQKIGLVGTPHYISPEMVYYNITNNCSKIDTPVDIWGIGIIFWECFSGKSIEMHHAFDDIRLTSLKAPLKIVFKIGELFTTRKFLYNHFYNEPKEKTSLAHLVWSCTRVDPEKRPLISEVIRRYQLWAQYAISRLKEGKIKSIHECFEEGIT